MNKDTNGLKKKHRYKKVNAKKFMKLWDKNMKELQKKIKAEGESFVNNKTK